VFLARLACTGVCLRFLVRPCGRLVGGGGDTQEIRKILWFFHRVVLSGGVFVLNLCCVSFESSKRNQNRYCVMCVDCVLYRIR